MHACMLVSNDLKNILKFFIMSIKLFQSKDYDEQLTWFDY